MPPIVFDPHSNFGYSTIQAGSSIIGSPATPKTIVLGTGDGADFPLGDGVSQFNIIVWPPNARPLGGNAEIIRVTRTGDILTTVARAQEGTAALTGIAASYQVMAGVTARTLTDIEAIAGALTYIGAVVYSTVNFGGSVLTFNAEEIDTDGFHGGGDLTRLTVPSGLDGVYRVEACVEANGDPGNNLFWGLQKNGVICAAAGTPDPNNNAFGTFGGGMIGWVGNLIVGDFMQVITHVSGAGGFNCVGGINGTRFSLQLVG